MNLEPIVLIWTGLAVVLLAVSAWMALDDLDYFETVRFAVTVRRAIKWGPRWWLTLGFLGANGLFCLVWLLLVAVGAVAISLPPPATEQRQAAQVTSGYLLIAMEACLAGIQAWWLLVRSRSRVFTSSDPTRARSARAERAALETARIGRPLLHEIANDLGVAVANAEALLLTMPLDPDDHERLAEIVTRLGRVTTDIQTVHELVRALGPEAKEALTTATVADPGGSHG